MTDPVLDLQELQRLHEAATPGPWHEGGLSPTWNLSSTWNSEDEFERTIVQEHLIVATLPTGETGFREASRDQGSRNNLALIIALRNALPALLSELSRLRQDQARLQWVRDVGADVVRRRNGWVVMIYDNPSNRYVLDQRREPRDYPTWETAVDAARGLVSPPLQQGKEASQ